MELGTIERTLFLGATPEVVYEVVSSPEHVREWWSDDADYEIVPGATGELVFGDRHTGGTVVGFTVMEAEPPRTFSFRWTHQVAEHPTSGNSLLVTFVLTPRDGGTLLTMTETGFRELGWETAALEQQYREHVSGWDFFLPRLERYVGLAVTR
jgi:uncharacterized protein YndB with AHSA1/START domain